MPLRHEFSYRLPATVMSGSAPDEKCLQPPCRGEDRRVKPQRFAVFRGPSQ